MSRKRTRRTGERAWADLNRDVWGIKWRDPVQRQPDGSPKYHWKRINGDNGVDPRTWDQCQPYVQRFLAQLPPEPSRCDAKIQPVDQLTLVQLAKAWHAAHPKLTSRDDYVWAVEQITGPVLEKGGGMGITYPQELSPRAISEWRTRREKGIDKKLAYLSAIINWAVENEYMLPIPVVTKKKVRGRQSHRRRLPAMTWAEYRLSMARAKELGQEALAHCLSTYGWRPLTACLAKVGMVDLKRRWIGPLHVKSPKRQDGEPHVHAHRLFPETCELLRPLLFRRGADGVARPRDPDEFLFTRWDGKPWPIFKGCAGAFSSWYRNHIADIAPHCGNAYAWKRFAIARMDRGETPWAKPLRNALKITFTGHITEEIIAHYSTTNEDEMEDAMDPVVVIEDDAETSQVVGGRLHASVSGACVLHASVPDEVGQDATEEDDDQANVIQFPPNTNH